MHLRRPFIHEYWPSTVSDSDIATSSKIFDYQGTWRLLKKLNLHALHKLSIREIKKHLQRWLPGRAPTLILTLQRDSLSARFILGLRIDSILQSCKVPIISNFTSFRRIWSEVTVRTGTRGKRQVFLQELTVVWRNRRSVVRFSGNGWKQKILER